MIPRPDLAVCYPAEGDRFEYWSRNLQFFTDLPKFANANDWANASSHIHANPRMISLITSETNKASWIEWKQIQRCKSARTQWPLCWRLCGWGCYVATAVWDELPVNSRAGRSLIGKSASPRYPEEPLCRVICLSCRLPSLHLRCWLIKQTPNLSHGESDYSFISSCKKSLLIRALIDYNYSSLIISKLYKFVWVRDK